MTLRSESVMRDSGNSAKEVLIDGIMLARNFAQFTRVDAKVAEPLEVSSTTYCSISSTHYSCWCFLFVLIYKYDCM